MIDNKISKFENVNFCVNIEKIWHVQKRFRQTRLDMKKNALQNMKSDVQISKTKSYFNCFYVTGCAFNDRK